MKKYLLPILLTLVTMTNAQQTPVLYAGGDISLLPQYEKFNTPYKDADGKKIPDVLTWLINDCHWNTFRVRLFVNPKDPNQEGVIQDLAYVKSLGKRIKDAGAYFMLDFHYSDTWVDATHIQAPAAWKDLSEQQMADTLGKYTTTVLEELNAAGATPDLVQVGNEIMYGLCGIQVHPYAKQGDHWDAYAALLKAGCNAVREQCPQAKIIIHTDRPTNSQYNQYYYQMLVNLGVDFDIIGLSYYPFWHGYLTDAQVASKQDKNNLGKAISQLAADFPDKEVQIVEAAYNFQYWPTSGVNYDTRDVWKCSVEGQYKFAGDLVAELKNHSNVTGISYWFPEENGNGGSSWSESTIVIKNWLSRGLWDSSAHTLNKVSATEHAALKIGTFVSKAEGVSTTSTTTLPTKQLIDNQLVIICNDKRYDMIGRPL